MCKSCFFNLSNLWKYLVNGGTSLPVQCATATWAINKSVVSASSCVIGRQSVLQSVSLSPDVFWGSVLIQSSSQTDTTAQGSGDWFTTVWKAILNLNAMPWGFAGKGSCGWPMWGAAGAALCQTLTVPDSSNQSTTGQGRAPQPTWRQFWGKSV